MAGAALLARLDAAIRELQAIRTEVAAALPPTEENGTDDLAEHSLVSVQAAAERFNIPSDTLRHKLRNDPGLGLKRGGVWQVSVPRLTRDCVAAEREIFRVFVRVCWRSMATVTGECRYACRSICRRHVGMGRSWPRHCPRVQPRRRGRVFAP